MMMMMMMLMMMMIMMMMMMMVTMRMLSVSSPEVAELAVATLQDSLLASCGLSIAMDKTQVWTPGGDPPPGSLVSSWLADGIVLLGAL